MPLRRILGLSAAASGHLRRRLSTSASHPPWAMIGTTALVRSPGQRSWFQLAEPPFASKLCVPEHLIDAPPSLDPHGDHIAAISGLTKATTGDGFLLLEFFECHGTAHIVTKSRGTLLGKMIDSEADPNCDTDPKLTRFVCNPITGELFRLPDIDGTKRTFPFNCIGLLTQSTRGHGPPDRYAVAALVQDRDGKEPSFVMRRFLSQTGEWDKLVGLPSPLPVARRIFPPLHQKALAFAGRLWWVDLSWGVISADPFSDRPELRFVELPRGSVLPEITTAADYAARQMSGMYRRFGVSEGRLHYVEMSQNEPFVLSSFALDDDDSGWMLKHQVALGRLLPKGGGHPWEKMTPWIGAIDPLNASAICVIIGDHALTVDIESAKVLGCANLCIGECQCEHHRPRTILNNCFVPCVLPPWLGSCRIPSADKKKAAGNKTLGDILVRSGRD